MIHLYQYPPTFGLPNASPFCMKVETYLRMAQLPYENKYITDPRKAPKGKLPYIEDKGKIIADSSVILDYLSKEYHIELDAALSSSQRAQARMLTHLLEEHFYWVMVHSRWVDEDNWAIVKKNYFSAMPPFVNKIVPFMLQKTIKRDLHGQGIGRHTPSEIQQLGIQDIQAVADFIANKPFVLGDVPTSVDATTYSFLANLLWVPLKSPMQDFALKQKNIVAYCEMMKERFFHQA